MPEAPTPETKAFLTALDSFMERPPGNLPEGAFDTIKSLRQSLKGYTGDEQLSAGEKEAKKVGGITGSDEAVHYSKAATGPDQPSPGQIEYQKAIENAQQALSSVGKTPGE